MPLVQRRAASATRSRAPAQARKIKPQYAEGPAREGRPRSQPRRGRVHPGLLLEEGIPSMCAAARSPAIRRRRRARRARAASRAPRRRAKRWRLRGRSRAGRSAAWRRHAQASRRGPAGRLRCVIARISSEARSNSPSESTGVPSKGSSRWSSTHGVRAAVLVLDLDGHRAGGCGRCAAAARAAAGAAPARRFSA